MAFRITITHLGLGNIAQAMLVHAQVMLKRFTLDHGDPRRICRRLGTASRIAYTFYSTEQSAPSAFNMSCTSVPGDYGRCVARKKLGEYRN